ncbi:MAG TPA: sigma-70 family RNA polymerase sigma factor [Bacteroidetes bacterium]|nr:sigma-70 family RNA polymerase sigma factor [Bacteroidota bacterium]
MRVEMRVDDYGIRPDVEDALERKIQKLENRLKRYDPESAELVVKIEKNPKKNIYRCMLELKVPGKTMVAKKEKHDQRVAVEEAFEALMKEFSKYRLKTNKNLIGKKKRQPVKLMIPAPQVEAWDVLFKEALKDSLRSLYRVARHELLNYQVTGLMEPGQVLPQEIVDDAIIAVYQRHDPAKTKRQIQRELMREVLRVARRYAQEARERKGRFISIERETSPIPPEEEVVTLGEEIMYFWEPDEAVRVEDEIPDPDAVTPDQVLEQEELQMTLYRLLSTLPEDLRTAFTLVVMEEMSEEEAAIVMEKSPEEVSRLVNEAVEQLRTLFAKAQVEMESAEVRELYGKMKHLPLEITVEARITEIFEILKQPAK